MLNLTMQRLKFLVDNGGFILRPAAAQHTLLGYFQSTLHLLWPPSESSERVVKSYGRHGLVPVSITSPLCPHTSHQFCFALLSKLILRFYFFIYPFSTLYYLSVPPVLHPPKSVTCAHTIILHWGPRIKKKSRPSHLTQLAYSGDTTSHQQRWRRKKVQVFTVYF